MIRCLRHHKFQLTALLAEDKKKLKIPTVIAKLAKQLGTLCVGMFSLPFGFEGRGKKGVALKAYAELAKVTDSLLLIENALHLNMACDSNKHFHA